MWAAIIAGVAAIVSIILQSNSNKDLAEYQADRNEEYLKEQQEYDSPVNQMARLKEAGLNPMLSYQMGSAGNQSQPLSFPSIASPDFIGAGRNVGQAGLMALEARLKNAQVQGIEAKTIESQARAGLTKIQTQIAENNPLLNKAVYGAMVESWISSAQIKAGEAAMTTQRKEFMTGTFKGDLAKESWRYDGAAPVGYIKMQRELQLLDQRFRLGESDQKIKAEVLESKEFQNAILEVQKKFMTDFELTPQHMVAFIQLLLMKLASK